MKLLGYIAFLFALLASIMLHEAGHFATAKAFGMKATRFFLGFGPTLWSFRRGETEYGVKALPAGGFVKILGMTRLEDLAPADEPRAFYRQPASRRAIVLAAGSTMHFLIAIVLVYITLISVGDIATPKALPVVQDVAKCATATGDCTAGAAASPAVAAGLQKGDRFVEINGQPVRSWTQLRDAVRNSPDKPVAVVVQRGGRQIPLTMTPARITDPDTHKQVGLLGVLPKTHVPSYSVFTAVPRTGVLLGTFVKQTFQVFGKLPHAVNQILENKPRDASGPASVIDVARLSGDIASAATGWGNRIGSFLLVVASLNLFVGIFNLLPLLPLDGGHLAILGYEESRSRLYRRIGRRDPGPVDLLKVLPVAYAVIALFVGLSLVLLYAGVFQPIRIQ